MPVSSVPRACRPAVQRLGDPVGRPIQHLDRAVAKSMSLTKLTSVLAPSASMPIGGVLQDQRLPEACS